MYVVSYLNIKLHYEILEFYLGSKIEQVKQYYENKMSFLNHRLKEFESLSLKLNRDLA